MRKLFYFKHAYSSYLFACAGNAGKVTVFAQQIGTSVDKSVFTTLQNQLTAFINNRKWTNDVYQAQEKIRCNFILTLNSVDQDNVYSATLAIQSARPVFDASYQTALINYQDGDVQFKYVQFQQLDFNENRIQGSEPLSANLTAVFAYYVYMILGFDYDSFSPKGGDAYFANAENIVNNAPEAKGITGWKAFDGIRNRYWLAENMMNSKYNDIHDIIYSYYREGLDKMYANSEAARSNILDALSSLQDFNQQNPNTMIAQFLVQGKSQEYIGIFKNGDPQSRVHASQILATIDVSNANVYKQGNEMKNWLWLIIFVFAACSENDKKIPKDILPLDKMKLIVWDLTQAGAYATMKSEKDSTAKSLHTVYFAEVLKMHHISKADFFKSFNFYQTHPLINQQLFDSVSAYADRQRMQLYRKRQ